MAQKREAGPVYAGSLDSSGANQAGHGASPSIQTGTDSRGSREGQGSLGASAEPCCTPPPTTSCKTRPGTNCPSPRLSVSWSPPEPYHWVWVHVGAIAVPKTPKWRPGLEDNKKKIHQTRKGPRSPARRNETEEGAQGQRESARGVRAGPGGRAVGVGAPGSPTSRQRRHCWSHD